MKNKMRIWSLFAGVALLAAAGSSYGVLINGVNIDFVSIGGAGNAADTDADINRNGYGAVGYNYQISQKEITFAQFAASGLGNGNEDKWVSTVGNSNAPVAKVSLAEAAQYCNWLTSGDATQGAYTISGGAVTAVDRAAALGTWSTVYVLPTEDEWYKAAYYNVGSGTYSLYANGTSTAPGQNTDSRYGNSLSAGPWETGVGTAEQNGTFDMMGNILEHTETLDGGQVVYRGGGYFQPSANLQSTWRTTDSITANYDTVGLRIVAIPEPGTISLMSLSTVGLFIARSIRRRRRIGASLIPVRRVPFCDAFTTEAEWKSSASIEQERDWLSVAIEELGRTLAAGWQRVHAAYASAEKSFWSRSVARHEKRLQKRMEFRANLKRKMLARLDTFLALIMK